MWSADRRSGGALAAASLLISVQAAKATTCYDNVDECLGDDCSCSQYGNNRGDPIDLAGTSGANSVFRRADARIQGSTTQLKLLREYTSAFMGYWDQDLGLFALIGSPFGRSPANSEAIQWWHNWFSFVAKGGSGLGLRNPEGQLEYFEACGTPPCWAAETNSPARQDRLWYSTSPEVSFSYFTPDNREFVYSAGPFDAGGEWAVYFLSSEVNSAGATVASLLYNPPRELDGGSLAPNCGPQGPGGVPYLQYVINEDGNCLDLRYEALDGGNGIECVLAGAMVGPNCPAAETTQVEYTYQNNLPGQLASAAIGAPGSSTLYTELYTEDGGFSVATQNGSGVLLRQTLESPGEVTATWSPSDASNVSVSGEVTPLCGETGASGSYVSMASSSATRGDGSTSDGGFTRTFQPQDGPAGINVPVTPVYTDTCTDVYACSEGSVSTGYACASWDQPPYGYPLYVQDKSGNYTIEPGEPAGDPSWPWEQAGLYKGVDAGIYNGLSVPGSPIGVDTETYSYTYGNWKEQLRSGVQRPSVSAAGETSASVKVFNTDGGNFLSEDLQDSFYPDGGSALIATFYWPQCKTNCGGSTALDPLNRTLEKHGPCFVETLFSADCDAESVFPITKYAYWSAASGDPKEGKLESESRYPSGSSSTPLTTTYNEYDSYGNATSIEDPAGITTTKTFTNSLLTQKTVGGLQTTNYGYDNQKLMWVEHPNPQWYEVSCYRTGGSSSDCDTTSGTFTPLLQWQAKCSSSSGSSCSERINYTYNGDGTVAAETYLDSSGTTRKVRQFQKDNQGRPTWEGWGQGTPVYSAVREFDASDNLTAVGLPYNGAPAFCDAAGQPATCPAVGPYSGTTQCQLMQNDCDNRLAWINDYPQIGSTPTTTRVAYDTNSNVCAVTVNATLSWQNSCTNTGAIDSFKTAYYQHDDFGNLTSVSLPDVGDGGPSGTIFYSYDALGDVVKKVLPDGTFPLLYSYDQLGRLTGAFWDNGMEQEYALAYDQPTTSPPSSCAPGGLTYTAGRLAQRTDSFGTTWYSYNYLGEVVHEYRLRGGSSACSSSTPDVNPATTYGYNTNGDLLEIIYPHGRTVFFTYGSGGSSGRISSANIYLYGSGGWASSPFQQISNVTWEPYGDLRAYQVNFSSSQAAAVEYMHGASATEPPGGAEGCPGTSGLGTDDGTGLVRAVWVSDAGLNLGENNGNILKVIYSWKADQVQTRDVCALGTSTPQRETFKQGDFAYDTGKPGYDQLLRVEHAEMPNFAVSGGSYQAWDFGCDADAGGCAVYGYDGRGNPSGTETVGFPAMTMESTMASSAGAMLDHLLSFDALNTSIYSDFAFAYDGEGAVASKTWHADSSGLPSHSLTFVHSYNGQTAALETLVQVTVQDGSSTGNYDYYYDAFARRTVKFYPINDYTDEYFYDLGHQMLEDRGYNVSGTTVTFADDDYVWLGGRPVAYVRGQFNSSWVESYDTTSNCSRMGDNVPCGVYFVVTDHIGKPVATLNSSAQIAGLYDYQVPGLMNRVEAHYDTAHPAGIDHGTSNCLTNTDVIADVKEAPAAPGLQVDVRTRFGLVDTGSAYAQVRDPDAGVCLDAGAAGAPTVGGAHAGAVVSNWMPTQDGHVQVVYYASLSNACPGGACYPTCPYCSSGLLKCLCNYPYTGVALDSVEYREYQPGATPLSIPIRFPGQYYDAETDLNENWNRYYDPSVGRYLETEPMWLSPKDVVSRQRNGMTAPMYSYASDNPINFDDPNALWTAGPNCQNLPSMSDASSEANGITDPCLKSCVDRKINEASIDCDSYQASLHCNQQTDPNEIIGAAASGIGQSCEKKKWWNFFGSDPSTVYWCGTLPSSCAAQAMVHEFAHLCGWKHGDGKGVPGDNGALSCDPGGGGGELQLKLWATLLVLVAIVGCTNDGTSIKELGVRNFVLRKIKGCPRQPADLCQRRRAGERLEGRDYCPPWECFSIQSAADGGRAPDPGRNDGEQ